jgi:hypothetical protein
LRHGVKPEILSLIPKFSGTGAPSLREWVDGILAGARSSPDRAENAYTLLGEKAMTPTPVILVRTTDPNLFRNFANAITM